MYMYSYPKSVSYVLVKNSVFFPSIWSLLESPSSLFLNICVKKKKKLNFFSAEGEVNCQLPIWLQHWDNLSNFSCE